MKLTRLLSFAVIFIFISATIYMTNMGGLQRPLLVLGLGMILISIFLVKTEALKYNVHATSIFILFIGACLFATIKNADVELGIGALLLLIIFIALTIVLPTLYKGDYVAFIAKCILIAHVPFILVSMVVDNFTASPFSGVFYTGNALGSVTATIYCVILAKFGYTLENVLFSKVGKYRSLLGYLLLLSALLYLTIMSGSRTSALTVILISFTLVGLMFIRALYIKKLRFIHFLKLSLYGLIIVPVFFIINIFIPLIEMFNQVIIGKFMLKQNDILDLRGIVWEQTFEKAGLFGGGRDFFVTETVAAALNTFISILGQYGWVALVLFSIYTIMSIYYGLKYMVSKNSKEYRYLPILMVTLFILLSTAESMMLKSSMLAFIALTGYVQFVILKESKVVDSKKIVLQGTD